MPWETVLVSCRHLVKFLFYPRFSTVNRVFEGTFLPHHLRQCPASLPLWSKQENMVNFMPIKALACRHLPQIHIVVYIVKFCSVHCAPKVWLYQFTWNELYLDDCYQIHQVSSLHKLHHQMIFDKLHFHHFHSDDKKY